MNERPSLVRRLGRGLDGLRRFLRTSSSSACFGALIVAAVSGRPKVTSGAALVLKPQGAIVEQLSAGDPVRRLAGQATGRAAAKETLLKDLLDALRAAKDDQQDQGPVPRPGGHVGGGA